MVGDYVSCIISNTRYTGVITVSIQYIYLFVLKTDVQSVRSCCRRNAVILVINWSLDLSPRTNNTAACHQGARRKEHKINSISIRTGPMTGMF